MKNLLGMDKIAHFGVGGLICAMFTFVAMLQDGVIGWHAMLMPFIGHVVVFIISFIKEAIVDGEFNWWDIVAAMIGCACIHISVFFGALFYTLSV